MRTRLGVALLLMVLGLAGCPAQDALHLSHSDDGGLFAIKNGGTIEIELAENASTGYRWYVLPEGLTPQFTLDDEEIIPSSSGLEGAWGFHRFIFDAESRGLADIRLGLFAPGTWPDGDPESVYTVSVDVIGCQHEARIWAYLDDGDAFEMRVLPVGGKVFVELVENPSTGYHWELTSEPAPTLTYDASMSGFESTNPDVPGAPGFQTFAFDAAAPGSVTLTLGLFAPGGEEPVETYEAFVVIGG